MQAQDLVLFQAALGLSDPWLVRSSPCDAAESPGFPGVSGVSGVLGCWGGVYGATTTGACAARSSAWACSAVGWVSFSNVLEWPCSRVVFWVWVASSARRVR
jgi:hypothetical protein